MPWERGEQMIGAGTGDTVGPGDAGRGERRAYGRALRTVFVLDVAGYGRRTVPDRDEVQQRLQRLVVAALAECGLSLGAGAVDHQWTGDGINGVLAPDGERPVAPS